MAHPSALLARRLVVSYVITSGYGQKIRWDGYDWVDCNTGIPVT
jgi:hypothetical protein